MANAKKCDRCGKFYSYEDKTFAIKHYDGKEKVVYGAALEFDHMFMSTHYDLCDDCSAVLYDFLSNYEAEG